MQHCFVNEKEAEAARKAQQEPEAALGIPRMLKPSQLEDKDEEHMNLRGNHVL